MYEGAGGATADGKAEDGDAASGDASEGAEADDAKEEATAERAQDAADDADAELASLLAAAAAEKAMLEDEVKRAQAAADDADAELASLRAAAAAEKATLEDEVKRMQAAAAEADAELASLRSNAANAAEPQPLVQLTIQVAPDSAAAPTPQASPQAFDSTRKLDSPLRSNVERLQAELAAQRDFHASEMDALKEAHAAELAAASSKETTSEQLANVTAERDELSRLRKSAEAAAARMELSLGEAASALAAQTTAAADAQAAQAAAEAAAKDASERLAKAEAERASAEAAALAASGRADALTNEMAALQAEVRTIASNPDALSMLRAGRDAATAVDAALRRAERVDVPSSVDSDDDSDDEQPSAQLRPPLDADACNAALLEETPADVMAVALTIVHRLTRSGSALVRASQRVVRGLEASASEKESLASQLDRMLKVREHGDRKNAAVVSNLRSAEREVDALGNRVGSLQAAMLDIAEALREANGGGVAMAPRSPGAWLLGSANKENGVSPSLLRKAVAHASALCARALAEVAHGDEKAPAAASTTVAV